MAKKIEKLTDVLPQRANANRHTARGMGLLEASIQKDGWIGAITVAADGETFDGSARIETGNASGFADVEPIIVRSRGDRPIIHIREDIPDADDPRAKRLGIAANRIGQINLEWESDVLAELAAEVDVDLGAYFLPDELAELAQPAEVEPGGGGDDFDTTPDDGPTRAQLGDLWQIGPHRLLVGDCTDNGNIERLMDGERAGAVFTSPPYDQQRTYEGNMAADWRALVSGAMLLATQYCEEDAQLFVNLGLVHRNGRVVRYWDGLIADLEDSDWPLFGWYVWDKLNGMPGDWNGRLAPAHEWVFHFAREHVQPEKIVKTKGPLGKNRSQRSADGDLRTFTQVEKRMPQPFKIPDSVIRQAPAVFGEASGHPAPFPIALPSQFMQAYNADIWYEPFCGSGTSIIAAHRTGRRCYGCEISPRYADVVLRRAEAEGLTVELLANG